MKKAVSVSLASLGVAAALALSACGGSPDHGHTVMQNGPPPAEPNGPVAAKFAPDALDRSLTNPVAVVKESGAKPDDGSVNGEWMTDGVTLVGSGSWRNGDGETVFVYSGPAGSEEKPDDGTAVIKGKGWVLVVLGPSGNFGGSRGPRPAVIAQRVHGRLLPGSPR